MRDTTAEPRASHGRIFLGFYIATSTKHVARNVSDDPMPHRTVFAGRNRIWPRAVRVAVEIQHDQCVEFSRGGFLPADDGRVRDVRLQEKISACDYAAVMFARDGERHLEWWVSAFVGQFLRRQENGNCEQAARMRATVRAADEGIICILAPERFPQASEP